MGMKYSWWYSGLATVFFFGLAVIFRIDEVLIRVFWPGETNTEVHFFNPTTDNLDNPKNLSFPDYRGFPVPAEKNGFQICNLHPKKCLLRKEKDVFFYMCIK